MFHFLSTDNMHFSISIGQISTLSTHETVLYLLHIGTTIITKFHDYSHSIS